MDIHANSDARGTVVKLFVEKIARYVTIDTVTGEVGARDVTLWYELQGCRGRGYVDESLFYSVARFEDRFITADSVAPRSMAPRSQFQTSSTGVGVCTSLQRAPSLNVAPASELKGLPFRTPVVLPLGFGG
jgi:hypothetical protein